MKYPKIVTAAMIAAAVTSLAACGSDDGGDAPPLPTTTAASASASGGASGGSDTDLTDAKKRPGVAALNDMLDKALDPNVPNSQKTQLVEGSSADPEIFDKLVAAKKENPGVTYKIIPPVIPAGPNKAKVKVQVKLPDNPPANLEAGITYSQGRWKLSKDTVCPLITTNGVKSAMCPAPASN
ncbi:hypothetical protein [Gordonia soli]|uniref:Low molecular weight antigen MTB12-like C-terminal domain-containing protein n=1 Tax=Gordonia soli NBRC 108243 TaxID=1223545 RepID=M0QRB5_9ACTN|nr:hypothetical protein [Gordonia soli]GAC70017.1 hypothetical protein GS4_30_00890 [Gordonia soli NBRC 108243]